MAIWARAQTKNRLPPLADYLIHRDAAPDEAQETKVAKLRSALEVLSAQTGIPLRRARPESNGHGQ